MRFLIDENLTPDLCAIAHAELIEASHLRDLGLLQTKDWHLAPIIFEGGFSFVTNNGSDFRGNPEHPGQRGEYAHVELHAGLICLNGVVNYADQIAAFEAAIEILRQKNWMLDNGVLEVWLIDGRFEIDLYDLPAP